MHLSQTTTHQSHTSSMPGTKPRGGKTPVKPRAAPKPKASSKPAAPKRNPQRGGSSSCDPSPPSHIYTPTDSISYGHPGASSTPQLPCAFNNPMLDGAPLSSWGVMQGTQQFPAVANADGPVPFNLPPLQGGGGGTSAPRGRGNGKAARGRGRGTASRGRGRASK